MTKPDSMIHSFEGEQTRHFNGLNKLEYFSAVALQGILSNPFVQQRVTEGPGTEVTPKTLPKCTAQMAISFARALIEELNNEEGR